MSLRNPFFSHVAQTSDFSMAFEVSHARGLYIYDTAGNAYMDLISGIAVANLGHSHPDIVEAVSNQAQRYMHTMVYGEHVQAPQVQLAQLIAAQLPPHLNNVFFVNSGSEAVEGALKLARKYTGRTEIISFDNAYHGSTWGALSAMGNHAYKNTFSPLLPDFRQIRFNHISDLETISSKTAAVIIEPIQGEAGAIVPQPEFIAALQKICKKHEVLIIADEIQTGMGRTGSMFAFEALNLSPDILLLAKAFGGGMPIGAFISDIQIMKSLRNNPILGHISTFGGHPVSAAAALTALTALLNSRIVQEVHQKENLIRNLLTHSRIKSIKGRGLMLAVELENAAMVQSVIKEAFERKLLLDWFLFNDTHFRLAPPLNISTEEIEIACHTITVSLDNLA